jgi:hypothetical protein
VKTLAISINTEYSTNNWWKYFIFLVYSKPTLAHNICSGIININKAEVLVKFKKGQIRKVFYKMDDSNHDESTPTTPLTTTTIPKVTPQPTAAATAPLILHEPPPPLLPQRSLFHVQTTLPQDELLNNDNQPTDVSGDIV